MAATRPLCAAEQAALLSQLDRVRDQLLVRFGLQTGFRISELLRLTVGDVWHAGAARTELTISRQHLKGGAGPRRRSVRSRTVPLHPTLRAAIDVFVREHLQKTESGEGAVLFRSRQGVNRPISYTRAFRILKAAAAAIGDPSRVAWHSTRKSFARSVYDGSGHDLVLTQRVVGHSSILATSRYLENTGDEVRAAILAVLPVPLAA